MPWLVHPPARRLLIPAVALYLLTVPASFSTLVAQDTLQTGTIAGTVLDDRGQPVAGAQVHIEGLALSANTRSNGAYVLRSAPAGSHVVRVRMLGFQPDSTAVRVVVDQQTTLDFRLRRD